MTVGLFRKQVHDPQIVGIDLGTTNSVVAIMKNKIPQVIKNEIGKSTTPSIVRIAKKSVVGEEAKEYLKTDPQNTIFASKRLIGRKFEDGSIKSYLSSLPYKTIPACNGDVWIKTGFGKYSPTQIGAMILAKMRNTAEKALKSPVIRAVITVPAYFNDSQRQETRKAAVIAGLDVVRIINEPTAAALAYGLDRNAVGNIAVYDLGGGTFDISILEVVDGVFHVKATNGNTFLGGEDFDVEFSNFIVNAYEQREGTSLDKNKMAHGKLKSAAESARIELSTKLKTSIFIEDIVPGQDLDIEVSREQLENVIKKVANRTIEPCTKALADANLKKSDIKHVILVGGLTRTPYIRKLVKDIFEIEPTVDVDPDEAVAQGAAIQAGILGGTVDNVLLLDVVPLSLGIETLGGVFSKIISRNTTIPFKQTETFSTSEDNQTEVDVRIFQGERAMVADNINLGSILLKNIPKAPRGKPRIDVTFEADSNGIIRVSAEDSQTGRKQEVEIVPSSGLTDKQVAKLIKEANKHRREDQDMVEMSNFKNANTKYLQDLVAGGSTGDALELARDLSAYVSKDKFDVGAAEKKLRKLRGMLR